MGDLRIRRPVPNIFILAVGLVIVGTSVFGFILLRQRPGVPREIARQNLVRIDHVDLESIGDEKFALAGKRIGMPADFYVRTSDGSFRKITASLVPYFGRTAIPWIYLAVGLFPPSSDSRPTFFDRLTEKQGFSTGWRSFLRRRLSSAERNTGFTPPSGQPICPRFFLF
jgi:hypothetical protein